MKKLPVAVAVIVLPLVLLSGCSSSAGSNSSVPQSDTGSGLLSSPEMTTEKSTAGGEASRDIAQPTEDKAVITTGYSTVLVKDLASASDEFSSLVTGAQGRIESRSENPATDYNSGSASFTVRIPSAQVDSFIDSLKGLGEAQEINLNQSDVTLEYKDLQSRIGALQAGIDRLTQLLAQADSTDSLITIENAITDRQIELDSLKTQELYLNDQISESTLTVSLVTESEADKKTPDDYSSAVGQGWEALAAFGTGIVVFFGLLTPWLIPLGVLAGVFFLVRYLLKRRGKIAAKPNGPVNEATEEAKEEEPTSNSTKA